MIVSAGWRSRCRHRRPRHTFYYRGRHIAWQIMRANAREESGGRKEGGRGETIERGEVFAVHGIVFVLAALSRYSVRRHAVPWDGGGAVEWL